MSQFDYLKNGQTVSELCRLREQVQVNSAAVLSVCRCEAEKAIDSATIRTCLQQNVVRAREILARLVEELRDCASHIPQPSGFFISDEHRKGGVKQVARLLTRIEEPVAQLRATSLEVSLLERTFAELAASGVFVEHRLRSTRQVARELGDEALIHSCDQLLSCLGDGRLSLEALRVIWTDVRGILMELCGKTLSDFGIRMAKSTGSEHDGQACNLSLVRALCGEMQHAAERILAQLDATDILKE